MELCMNLSAFFAQYTWQNMGDILESNMFWESVLRVLSALWAKLRPDLLSCAWVQRKGWKMNLFDVVPSTFTSTFDLYQMKFGYWAQIWLMAIWFDTHPAWGLWEGVIFISGRMKRRTLFNPNGQQFEKRMQDKTDDEYRDSILPNCIWKPAQ